MQGIQTPEDGFDFVDTIPASQELLEQALLDPGVSASAPVWILCGILPSDLPRSRTVFESIPSFLASLAVCLFWVFLTLRHRSNGTEEHRNLG